MSPSVGMLMYVSARGLFSVAALAGPGAAIAWQSGNNDGGLLVVLLAVGLLLCVVPSYYAKAVGDRVSRATSRLYTCSYVVAWVLAGGSKLLTDSSAPDSVGSRLAESLFTLALVGVLGTLLAHAKNAIEAWVKADDDEAKDGARLEGVAQFVSSASLATRLLWFAAIVVESLFVAAIAVFWGGGATSTVPGLFLALAIAFVIPGIVVVVIGIVGERVEGWMRNFAGSGSV